MIRVRDVKSMIEARADGFIQGDAEGWLRTNGISGPAFRYVCEQLEQTLKHSLVEGALAEIMGEEEELDSGAMMACAIQAIVGVAFTIGWELHKEYGDRSEIFSEP